MRQREKKRANIQEGPVFTFILESVITRVEGRNANNCTEMLCVRDQTRLRVFENRVLRRIFGPKRDGVTGEWIKLHNEELNDLYSSPNIVRVIK